jgi:hypothetical protein
MKKRMLSLLLMLAVMVSLAPAAFATQKTEDAPGIDLTVGGYICLTEDVYLEKSANLNKDTALDLNGHIIDGAELVVSEGVELSFKNGTMRADIWNYGECRVENVRFFSGCIRNSGHISVIRDCTMEYGGRCVSNEGSGVIDLIENCDIKSRPTAAVWVGEAGAVSRIECIRNCLLRSEEKSALGDYGGTIGKVENCILVGKLGGHESSGGAEVFENCVIVGLGKFAVFQKELVQSAYRDCIFISDKWEGGRWVGLMSMGSVNAPKPPKPNYNEEELLQKEKCEFLLRDDIKLQSYTTWKMKQPGFDNFKTANTYTAGQFGDVAESFWGAPNIARAYELGLMKGEGANTFAPNGTVTVAQTLTMAARLHSICTTGQENFVQSGVWYQTYVDYCKANAILNRDFADYNAPIKRCDFADIMAAALPAAALSAINDIEEIPDVAKSEAYAGGVYTLYRAGVLTGNDAKGTFGPETTINRAAAAAIVTRMADPALRKNMTL